MLKNVNLAIDARTTVEILEKYIGETVETHGAKGVVLGLSGGIDSAVLACLAVQALGPNAVHAWYLFDHHSDPDSSARAELLAHWLTVILHKEDISEIMARQGIYAHAVMQGRGMPHWLNRLVHNTYHRLFGETPFMSSLRLGSGTTAFPPIKSRAYNMVIRPINEGFEARHIYRRTRLEQLARDNHWLLPGGANRSEVQVGWFIKDGIDDVPMQPLSGLYKTQVRQLAEYIGIPEKIRTAAPSPDMRHGITDEFGMGIDYQTLDAILDLIAHGLSDREISKYEVTTKKIALVRELHRFSQWKRTSPAERPPVDGGPAGALRLNPRTTPETIWRLNDPGGMGAGC